MWKIVVLLNLLLLFFLIETVTIYFSRLFLGFFHKRTAFEIFCNKKNNLTDSKLLNGSIHLVKGYTKHSLNQAVTQSLNPLDSLHWSFLSLCLAESGFWSVWQDRCWPGSLPRCVFSRPLLLPVAVAQFWPLDPVSLSEAPPPAPASPPPRPAYAPEKFIII